MSRPLRNYNPGWYSRCIWRCYAQKPDGPPSPLLRVARHVLPLRQPPYRGIVNFSARLCLGLVLVVAAVAKLLDLNGFARRVGDFGLVYDAAVTPTAWAIVLAELLIGISLMLRLRGSVTCVTALLLLFISVLTYGLALGLDVECGCFGPAVQLSLGMQLFADFGLLLMCAIIYITEQRRSNASFVADDSTSLA